MQRWPLILAGPIVRHVQPDQASVWVALSAPRTVSLELWEGRHHTGGTSGLVDNMPAPRGTGLANTRQIGPGLHIAVVTVPLAAGSELMNGRLYSYNLTLVGPGSTEDLRSLGLLVDGTLKLADGTATDRPHLALGYDPGFLPAFATPPEDLNQVNLVHGSCRKLHGEGIDALPGLDQLIGDHVADATARPQLLFFTGDQLYADDVTPMILPAAHGVGSALLWGTSAQGVPVEGEFITIGEDYLRAELTTLPSGWRKWPACFHGRFSAGGVSRSHLMTFSEYCGLHLLMWSNAAWPLKEEQGGILTHPSAVLATEPTPLDLPDVFTGTTHEMINQDADWETEWIHWHKLARLIPPDDLRALMLNPEIHFEVDAEGELIRDAQGGLVHRDLDDLSGLESVLLAALKRQWFRSQETNEDAAKVTAFYQGLPRVRRALANVATWMNFDDHDITDDWYISGRWHTANIESLTGRAMIRNGLMAFTLFQGWGNDPKGWAAAGSDKLKLLDAAEQYGAAISVLTAPNEENPGTLKEVNELLGLRLVDGKPATPKIDWHFKVLGPRFQVFVLDERTRRTYPTLDSPPLVLSEDEIRRQIPGGPRPQDELVFVVSSLPLFGHPYFDEGVHPIAMRLTTAFVNREIMIEGDARTVVAESGGHYKVEPEHWPLQDRAREAMLKHLSKFGAVAVLSGEVHYSASFAVDYWEAGSATARILQLTSSAMLNAEPDRVLQSLTSGAGQWFLAHSLTFTAGDDGFGDALSPLPATDPEQVGRPLVMLGWTSPDHTLTVPAGTLIPFHHRPGLHSAPAVVHNRDWPQGTTFDQAPDWVWRLQSLQDLRRDADRPGATPPGGPVADPADGPMGEYAAALAFHATQAGRAAPRRHSYHTFIGQVRFSGAPGARRISHELWSKQRDDLRYAPYMVHETRLGTTTDTPPGLEDQP